MQKTIDIKTFANGDKLTCTPCKGGVGELMINGKRAVYQPLITPKKHSSGQVIVAVVDSKYALTETEIDAILAANQHYAPTLIDRMNRIWQLEDTVRDRQAEVGSARNAAVEYARIHGVKPSHEEGEMAELAALAKAGADLAAAIKADPEAWQAVQTQRREAIDRAMNH
jgi:hypothetical protein